jgi:ubiquinone/menaquinone biosynthesis C-methylase UbiE
MTIGLLDAWLYRRPFEGRGARRYARAERPAFGDLDARLCEAWAADLAAARVVLDVGAGPGSFLAAARARWPHLVAIDVEPSAAFSARRRGGLAVRARGEALPLGDGAVDLAVSISAIRHVADRLAALRELRRVVRPGGAVHLVELDPAADRARVRRHARALGSPLLRAAFAPLVLRTAPPAAAIAQLARRAGWTAITRDDDPAQPLYRMRLA